MHSLLVHDRLVLRTRRFHLFDNLRGWGWTFEIPSNTSRFVFVQIEDVPGDDWLLHNMACLADTKRFRTC